jgi:hypothetical protein
VGVGRVLLSMSEISGFRSAAAKDDWVPRMPSAARDLTVSLRGAPSSLVPALYQQQMFSSHGYDSCV